MSKIKVMFVCMGNICRSPTAHAVFRDLVNKNGLADKIEIASSGTHSYHIGSIADNRSRQVANKNGIKIDDLRAQKIINADLSYFDFILAMDRDNLDFLKSMADKTQQHKIHLFLEYANKDWHTLEVPDPYFGAGNGFNIVFDMVLDASDGLLTTIRQSLTLGN